MSKIHLKYAYMWKKSWCRRKHKNVTRPELYQVSVTDYHYLQLIGGPSDDIQPQTSWPILFQIIARHEFTAKPLYEPNRIFCQNTKFFIKENILENVVCIMAVILLGLCVFKKNSTAIVEATWSINN